MRKTLPYKQGVTGSSPVVSTKKNPFVTGFLPETEGFSVTGMSPFCRVFRGNPKKMPVKMPVKILLKRQQKYRRFVRGAAKRKNEMLRR